MDYAIFFRWFAILGASAGLASTHALRAEADAYGTVQKINSVLSDLNRQGTRGPETKDCIECQAIHRHGQAGPCPGILGDMLSKNKRSNSLGTMSSPRQNCSTENVRKNFKSASDLESFLDADQRLRLSARSSGLRLLDTRCPGAQLADEERREMISEYYYLSNRLRRGVVANMEMIASVDVLLGKWEGSEFCSIPHLSESQKWCQKFRSCHSKSGQAGLKSLTDGVFSKFLIIEQLRDYIENGVPDSRGYRHYAKPSEIRAWGKQINFLRSTTPILNGKVFNRAINKVRSQRSPGAHFKPDEATKGLIQQAVIDQLNENRKALLKRQAALKDSFICLHSEQKEGCEQFWDVLKNTPDMLYREPRSNVFRPREIAATIYLANAACRLETRESIDTANQIVRDTAIDLALSAVPLGAVWARAVVKASQAAGKTVSVGAKLGAVHGVLAADAANLGYAGAIAFAECQKKLDLFDRELSAPNTAGSEAHEPNVSCPSEDTPVPNALSEYDHCMTAIFISVTPALAPLVPFVSPSVRKLLVQSKPADAVKMAPAIAKHTDEVRGFLIGARTHLLDLDIDNLSGLKAKPSEIIFKSEERLAKTPKIKEDGLVVLKGFETVPPSQPIDEIRLRFDDPELTKRRYTLVDSGKVPKLPFKVEIDGQVYTVKELEVKIPGRAEPLSIREADLMDPAFPIRRKIRVTREGLKGGHTYKAWKEFQRRYPETVLVRPGKGATLESVEPQTFNLSGSPTEFETKIVHYEYDGKASRYGKTLFRDERQLKDFEDVLAPHLARKLEKPIQKVDRCGNHCIQVLIPGTHNGKNVKVPVRVYFENEPPGPGQKIISWFVAPYFGL